MKTKFLIMAAAIALTACNSNKMTVATAPAPATPQQQETQKLAYDLLEGDWTILDINGEQMPELAVADRPYFRFNIDNEHKHLLDLVVYTGCNYINGVISLDDNKITKVGEMLATLKVCPGAKFEQPIISVLEKMRTLKIQTLNNESFLYLMSGSGTMMTLRRHNINYIEGAWQVTKVKGQNTKEMPIRMVIDLADSKVHGNAGCNVMNGELSLNMAVEGGISFSNIVTTRMACPDLESEYQYLNALAEVKSVKPVHSVKGKVETADLLNAAGEPVIEIKRISRELLEK